jgi:hypothetical protein
MLSLDEGRHHQAPARERKPSHVANLHWESRLLDSDLREFSRGPDADATVLAPSRIESFQMVTVK